MHTIVGRIIKYIIWVLFIFILGMLLIGLAKFRGNVGNYISYLNARDRNEAWGKTSVNPSSWGYIFRGSGTQSMSGEIDLLSGENLSGDIVSGEDFTGLNAFDPNLEADLNNLSGDTSFGFT